MTRHLGVHRSPRGMRRPKESLRTDLSSRHSSSASERERGRKAVSVWPPHPAWTVAVVCVTDGDPGSVRSWQVSVRLGRGWGSRQYKPASILSFSEGPALNTDTIRERSPPRNIAFSFRLHVSLLPTPSFLVGCFFDAWCLSHFMVL